MRVYQKPAMIRQLLESSKKISNTCWGYHTGGSPTWWYDKNGTARGFVSFYIHKGTKCGELGQMLTVIWYQNRDALNSGNGREVIKGESVITDGGQTVYPFDDTEAYLIASGGSQGNPFSGENNLIEDNDSMV